MKYTKVETVELEDDYEGQHVALDLACGVFDLIGDEAVQAAETACGGREPGMVKRECPDERGQQRGQRDEPRLIQEVARNLGAENNE